MSDKIQMTEEQIDIFITNCVTPDLRPYVKNQAIKHGYIIKSDLQQKVEEAENIWIDFYSAKGTTFTYRDIIEKYYDVIQLLKQSHPEFKR